MSGPCCICGAMNYAPSIGGPTICPKCDCGNFDAATVMKQAKYIKTQAARIEQLEATLREINGIVGAWQRTPTADRYSTEVMRQALALQEIARAALKPAS